MNIILEGKEMEKSKVDERQREESRKKIQCQIQKEFKE